MSKEQSEQTVSIVLNGEKIEVKKNSRLIDIASQHGCQVPRFCYHEKLSVVASCRMCLVDIEGVNKPVPSCATAVSEGMVVQTRSKKAVDAQESVMQFLLMKHPLHCPVCDQGGECELQDVSMGYGKAITNYSGEKRAEVDEDLGALVATDMSLCIHCTRCVRFGEEVAGVKNLGLMGRSDQVKISTYLERGLQSEWSGNMVDICPVGALTSKPAKFSGRSWSYVQHEGIAAHDCLGAHISYHTMAKGYGSKHVLKRVVPRPCAEINSVWLSDRDRFSYEGLAHNRIETPMLRVGDTFRPLSWDDAGQYVMQMLADSSSGRIGGIVSPQTITEDAVAFKTVLDQLSADIDVGTHQNLGDELLPLRSSQLSLHRISKAKTIILIGCAVRWDQPYISLSIKEAVANGAKVLSLGSIRHQSVYPVHHEMVTPQMLVRRIGILFTQWDQCGSISHEWKQALQDPVVVLVGEEALIHPQAQDLRHLIHYYASVWSYDYALLPQGANHLGLSESGLNASQSGGTPWLKYTQKPLACLWVHDLDPVVDLGLNVESLAQTKIIVSASHWSLAIKNSADLVLPTVCPPENSGTYINYLGMKQHFSQACAPMHDARSLYQVCADLSEKLQIELNSKENLTRGINQSFTENTEKPIKIPQPSLVPEYNQKLMPIVLTPWVQTDLWVRNAPSLQKAYPKTKVALVHKEVSAKDIQALGYTQTLQSQDIAVGAVLYYNSDGVEGL